jgi:hypothetical protein
MNYDFKYINLFRISFQRQKLKKKELSNYYDCKNSYMNCIGGIMVDLLALIVVDHGFISGVMVSLLALSVVGHGFISGVMVGLLAFSVVDHGFISGVMVI